MQTHLHVEHGAGMDTNYSKRAWMVCSIIQRWPYETAQHTFGALLGDELGPEFNIYILRVHLILISIFSSCWSAFYITYFFEENGEWQGLLYLFLLFFPIFFEIFVFYPVLIVRSLMLHALRCNSRRSTLTKLFVIKRETLCSEWFRCY